MTAALHVSNIKLDEVRVVIFGSGTAGTGIADQIADTIATETHKPKTEASKQIWHVLTLSLICYKLTPPFQVYRQTRSSRQIARR